MPSGDAPRSIGYREAAARAQAGRDRAVGREGAGDEPPDFDRELPGFKPAHERDREEQERQNAMRREYRAQERQRVRDQNRPPASSTSSSGPSSGPTSSRSSRSSAGSRRAKRRSSSRSSGSLGIRRAARSASVVNPTGGELPIGITPGGGAAGLFFGAIAYALVLSVIDYGPSGPLLWFKAKFLNQAVGAPSASSPAPVNANPPPSVAGPPAAAGGGGSMGPGGSNTGNP